MSANRKNWQEEEKELVAKAIISRDNDELDDLSNSNYMNVRRAVVRNRFISSFLIQKLASDPVKNVSIHAIAHPSYKGTRVIEKGKYADISECLHCKHDMCQGNSCKNNGKKI